EGAAGGLYRHVAVAAQLEVGRALVIDLPEGGHDGGEVEVALAGEEVLVPVATHPLEVHVDDLARAPSNGCRRTLLGHVGVADVERETETRLSDPVADAAETRQIRDVHPGLGLEAQDHAMRGCIAREQPETLREALVQARRRLVRFRPARPEGDHFRAEQGGDADRALKEIDSALAVFAPRGEKRGPVLAPGIEQEARAGLDHGHEVVLGQPGADRPRLPGRRAVVRIERPGIEREGDALEAEPGDDLERIAQAMGGEAVGVVAETHVRWDYTCAGAPWPATRGTRRRTPRGLGPPRRRRSRRRAGAAESLRRSRARSGVRPAPTRAARTALGPEPPGRRG